MRQKSGTRKEPAEKVVRGIRRATRKQDSAAEKSRMVLRGLRGEGPGVWRARMLRLPTAITAPSARGRSIFSAGISCSAG